MALTDAVVDAIVEPAVEALVAIVKLIGKERARAALDEMDDDDAIVDADFARRHGESL